MMFVVFMQVKKGAQWSKEDSFVQSLQPTSLPDKYLVEAVDAANVTDKLLKHVVCPMYVYKNGLVNQRGGW